jgi:hypothetical protein
VNSFVEWDDSTEINHIQLMELTEGQRKWGAVISLGLFTLVWASLFRWNLLSSLPTEGLTIDTLREVGLFVMLLSTGSAAILRGVQASKE